MKNTVPKIIARKNQKKISALTAYDYSIAKLIDSEDIDIILVGDSLGNVVKGNKTTLDVTIDEIIYHSKCVSKACKNALLVADMPFMSVHTSNEQALENSRRVFAEGNVNAIKIEGGVNISERISLITKCDLPVMGHIGLTPQSYNFLGGYIQQGTGTSVFNSQKIIEDAFAVQEAGVFSIVLEHLPSELATEITEKLSIPTIGIGSGPNCDGQIAVSYDILGISSKVPKFVDDALEAREILQKQIKKFIKS